MDAAAPPGLEVLEAINVRVGPGKILIPDLAVVTQPGLEVAVCDAAQVVLVAEIASPGSALVDWAVMDRAVKPQLYGQAGVPHYLRVEMGMDGPGAVLYRLHRRRYAELEGVAPGRPLVLTDPLAVTLDLATLAAATRPAR